MLDEQGETQLNLFDGHIFFTLFKLFYIISEISFKFSSAIKVCSSSFLVTPHSNPMKTSFKIQVEKKCAESFACIYYSHEDQERLRHLWRVRVQDYTSCENLPMRGAKEKVKKNQDSSCPLNHLRSGIIVIFLNRFSVLQSEFPVFFILQVELCLPKKPFHLCLNQQLGWDRDLWKITSNLPDIIAQCHFIAVIYRISPQCEFGLCAFNTVQTHSYF